MTLRTRVLLWLLPAMVVLAVGQFWLLSRLVTRDSGVASKVALETQNSNNPAGQVGVPLPPREFNNSLPLPTPPVIADAIRAESKPVQAKPIQQQPQAKPSTATTITKPATKSATNPKTVQETRATPRVSSPAVTKPSSTKPKTESQIPTPATPIALAPSQVTPTPSVAGVASPNPMPVVTSPPAVSAPSVETPVKPINEPFAKSVAGTPAPATPAPPATPVSPPTTATAPSEASPPASETSVPSAKPEPSRATDQEGSQTSNLEKTDTQLDTSSQTNSVDPSSQDNLASQTPDLQKRAEKSIETPSPVLPVNPAPVIPNADDKSALSAPASEATPDTLGAPVKPNSQAPVVAKPQAPSSPTPPPTTTNKVSASGTASTKPVPQVQSSTPAPIQPNLKSNTPAQPVQVARPSSAPTPTAVSRVPSTLQPVKPPVAVTQPLSIPSPKPPVRAQAELPAEPTMADQPKTPDRLAELEQLTASGAVLVRQNNGRLEFEAVTNQNNWVLLSSVGLLVLALGLGAFGVRRSLTPLYTLAGEIERRNASSLGLIATPPMPELRPAVNALNRLLLDMGETLERLKTQEASARRFAYNASHELRNPLTATRNYLEVLERHPTQVEATQGALNALDRTERILSSLLQLARLEGQGTPKRERIDLSSFLEAHFDVPVQGTGEVWAERDLLELSLENLVNNATNHAGGARNIRVETVNNNTWLWVEDAGPGFNLEILPRAFEPFAKLGAGTGLGLAIVEAVARVHGGTVRAENRIEGGARVGLSLPAFFV